MGGNFVLFDGVIGVCIWSICSGGGWMRVRWEVSEIMRVCILNRMGISEWDLFMFGVNGCKVIIVCGYIGG